MVTWRLTHRAADPTLPLLLCWRTAAIPVTGCYRTKRPDLSRFRLRSLSVADAKLRDMSVSVSTTALSMVSAAIAVTSLLWAVRSWRLSGPALRLHCLVYESEVVIRTFNAGRVPETVEGLVLGGLRTGRNGLDLTEPLGLPFRLEPGEAKKWRLHPGADEMAHLALHVHSGWASLWVLTGSMRQHRVEVMPTIHWAQTCVPLLPATTKNAPTSGRYRVT